MLAVGEAEEAHLGNELIDEELVQNNPTTQVNASEGVSGQYESWFSLLYTTICFFFFDFGTH